MSGEHALRAQGLVIGARPPATFLVELPNGHRLYARVPRKQAHHVPRVKTGGRVTVEVTPFDLSKGVIIFEEDETERDT